MFEMNCPSCGKGMKWWLDGLVRVNLNSRVCSNCGIKLELLNPGLCYFVNGIIFAGILMGVVFRNLPVLWLWILFGGVFCWFINPVIVRVLGRWGGMVLPSGADRKGSVFDGGEYGEHDNCRDMGGVYGVLGYEALLGASRKF